MSNKKQKDILFKFEHILKNDNSQLDSANQFCEGYKEFLDASKTERECVDYTLKLLKKAGYKEFDVQKKYKAGDKVYYINRNKSIIMTTFGKEELERGIKLNAAHIDSPRLDLKPNPLYEKNDLALFKTHYYGGIKKYQWVTMPLSLHGVVVLKDGKEVNIVIGEDEKDPVFFISDLLPHISKKQDERKLSEGITGEELNVIIGSLPDYESDESPFKYNVMKILNEKYKITERDFARAELEVVPANKAKDVGLDRSMVGSYGQDDRVCSYTALMAELDIKNPKYTTITLLTDKEEIGSRGNTGVYSDFLKNYIKHLCKNKDADYIVTCRNSACLSADVHSAYDPTFGDAFDEYNSGYLNKGCVLSKYSGARGKSGASDASAEFMSKVIDIMDEAGVHWQTGEIGKVDLGGGGTVAADIAKLDIDVVDLGVPVLAMHSPYEVTAKLDIYNTYLAFKAFFESDK